METKCKRTLLTANERYQICLYKEAHPAFNRKDMCDMVERVFGKRASRTTISEILRNKKRWMQPQEEEEEDEEERKTASRRKNVGKYPELETAIVRWLEENKENHFSNKLIFEKAKQLGEELGIKTLSYSQNWFFHMKRRRGIPSSKALAEQRCAREFERLKVGEWQQHRFRKGPNPPVNLIKRAKLPIQSMHALDLSTGRSNPKFKQASQPAHNRPVISLDPTKVAGDCSHVLDHLAHEHRSSNVSHQRMINDPSTIQYQASDILDLSRAGNQELVTDMCQTNPDLIESGRNLQISMPCFIPINTARYKRQFTFK